MLDEYSKHWTIKEKDTFWIENKTHEEQWMKAKLFALANISWLLSEDSRHRQ